MNQAIFDPRPVTLNGVGASLEPMAHRHADDLFQAGGDSDIWRYMPISGFADRDAVRRWIAQSVARAEDGAEIPFAVIDPSTGRAVGSTRFMDIRREHRGLEIGYTWLSREARRTGINTECKYLLLCHAFDTLGAIRVQFKTDSRNLRSQTAIERIGGEREGVLRRHMICWDGALRDSVYYSVINDDWPAVKQRLIRLLRR